MIERKMLEEAANSIIESNLAKAEEIAHKTLEMGWDPMEMLNQGFISGIVKVGDLFDRGELFLPELIQCSEVMKNATLILNAKLTSEKNKTGGKVLVATVEGDIHDIGKGIVISLLKAHGLEVIDAGRDVPIEEIVEKAEEFAVDVIGTSALLTTTMVGQKKLEEILRSEGIRDKYKTVVGGAPLTERWAKKIGADAYAEDANDGVKKIFELIRR